MRDVDAAFEEEILNIPQRKRIAHVHNHDQANDLSGSFEMGTGTSLRYGINLAKLSNRVSSNTARYIPLSLSPVHDGREEIINRWFRLEERLVDEITQECVEDLPVRFNAIGPGV